MAHLTQQEFSQAVNLMAEELGLQGLRDRLVRLNALVTRRRVASADRLANQLYMLTSGLRRQVPATVAFHSLWAEQVNARVGEEGEKELEKLAEQINACLDQRHEILPEKEGELESTLQQYEQRLANTIGSQKARIDMLLKAMPAVATKLRSLPMATPASAEQQEAPEAPAEEPASRD
jgi:hypothetical protein